MTVPTLPPWLYPPPKAVPLYLKQRFTGTSGVESFLFEFSVPPSMNLRIATFGLIGGTVPVSNPPSVFRFEHPALSDLRDLFCYSGNNFHSGDTPIMVVIPANETVRFYCTPAASGDHAARVLGWYFPV